MSANKIREQGARGQRQPAVLLVCFWWFHRFLVCRSSPSAAVPQLVVVPKTPASALVVREIVFHESTRRTVLQPDIYRGFMRPVIFHVGGTFLVDRVKSIHESLLVLRCAALQDRPRDHQITGVGQREPVVYRLRRGTTRRGWTTPTSLLFTGAFWLRSSLILVHRFGVSVVGSVSGFIILERGRHYSTLSKSHTLNPQRECRQFFFMNYLRPLP